MEGDPHQLIEGMMLAGYATRRTSAYIFIRGEYKLSAQRISARRSPKLTRRRYLGKNILGSALQPGDVSARQRGTVHVRRRDGMLNALEGKRANPRAKPPFPQVSGLVGQADHRQQCRDPVQRPAHREPRRELVPGPEPHQGRRHQAVWRQRKSEAARVCGSFRWAPRCGKSSKNTRGHARRASLSRPASGRRVHRFSGGSSISIVPMDFTEVAQSGQPHGDRHHDRSGRSDLSGRDAPESDHFFAQESCGWCTPCWSGLAWADHILNAMEEGRGESGDLEKLAVSDQVSGTGPHVLRARAGRRGALAERAEILSRRFSNGTFAKNDVPWR